MTNCSRYRSRKNQDGFTLLELVLVVLLISVLAFFALNRFYKLMVDAERAAMESVIGAIQSAVSLQIADHYTAGDMQGLAKLVRSNPMELLQQKPKSYLGVISHYQLDDIEKGSWFYDRKAGQLIYMVRHQLYFETSLAEPKRARFKIAPPPSGKKQKDQPPSISWLELQVIESYRWLKPWG